MSRRVFTTIFGVALSVAACSGSSTPASEEPTVAPVAQTDESSGDAPEQGPGTLSFRVLAHSDKGEHGLSPGASLHSGDKIAMSVNADREMYVYIMQFFPDRSAAVLYPAPGEDNKVKGSMRLPPGGWFQLDEVVGEENVYVVASLTPLAEADAQVMATVEEVRQSGAAPVESEAGTRDIDPAGTEPEQPDAVTPAVAEPDAGNPAPEPKSKPKRPRKPKKPRGIKGTGSGAGGAPRISMMTRGLTRVDEDGEGPLLHMETDEAGVAISVFSFQHLPKQ